MGHISAYGTHRASGSATDVPWKLFCTGPLDIVGFLIALGAGGWSGIVSFLEYIISFLEAK
jgi:hypothetical protein